MDARLSNAIVQAVKDTTKDLVGKLVKNINITEKAIVNKKDDVAAVIGFKGEIKGFFILRTPYEKAVYIGNRILNTDEDELSKDIQDAFGEFLNIVVGIIKKYYIPHKDTYKFSLPNIMVNKDLTPIIKDESNVTTMSFEGDGMEFEILTSLH
ncbi:chemotaxis protein CheX [Spirochaetota bacterium]